jgi:hypothetical protein
MSPPVEIARMPLLQRLEHAPVGAEVDVVGDRGGVVDVDGVGHGVSLERLISGSERATGSIISSCRRSSGALAGAVALQRAFGAGGVGRWKIQFCQAVRRPKMRVSMVSGPAKRRLASSPVRASGEKLARSSWKMRISSSQSMSSKAKGDEAEGFGGRGVERLAGSGAGGVDRLGRAEKAGLEPRQAVAHGIAAEIDRAQRQRRPAGCRRRSGRAPCRSGRWRTPVRRACRQSSCRARSGRPASARSRRCASARASTGAGSRASASARHGFRGSRRGRPRARDRRRSGTG